MVRLRVRHEGGAAARLEQDRAVAEEPVRLLARAHIVGCNLFLPLSVHVLRRQLLVLRLWLWLLRLLRL